MRKLKLRAYHKKSGHTEDVLLICFVNKYVDVLPEYELEGGNQLTWKFSEIELWQNVDRDGKKWEQVQM